MFFGIGPTGAQQINGVPGSPTSTVTLDGKQLPPQPMKFGGVINETADKSTPWAATFNSCQMESNVAATTVASTGKRCPILSGAISSNQELYWRPMARAISREERRLNEHHLAQKI